eukprot:TRINITY_DN5367_c0_g1_i4.p1 TRINITY_DN5367_c0_g1~~TRINITY_DN5367_c0_g1_i4.p1  ORF type:complete len:108 (-),score=22.16 TRINITY_DN5367_c0_g1_i4:102-425(-)
MGYVYPPPPPPSSLPQYYVMMKGGTTGKGGTTCPYPIRSAYIHIHQQGANITITNRYHQWEVCGMYTSTHTPYIPYLSLIHISEPTRLLSISYAVFCLKKKKKKNIN